MQTNLETNALAIIDVLAEEGDFFTADYGQVLVTLTRRIYGEDKKVGDPEYKAISLAVLYLEQAELITVDRAHRDESQKANVVLSLRLA
jgi:hypothetical protein